jgi:ABC-type dipeptide/oligopeptide/nickel transport system permease component
VAAVLPHDIQELQGVVLLTGGVFALFSLAVDLLYAWLDPRLRIA